MFKLNFNKFSRDANRYCGISLAESSLSLAIVRQASDQFILETCVSQPLAQADAFENVLSALITQHKLYGVSTSLVLAFDEYELVQTDDIAVPEAELRGAFRWKLKELIDTPPTHATFDVFRIPPHGAGKHRKMVYVVAANMKVLQKKVEVLQRLPLKLNSIDIDIFALRNMLTLLSKDVEGCVLLSIHPHRNLIIYTGKSGLYLAHRINTKLSTDKPELMQNLIQEVQRSFDYYQKQLAVEMPTRFFVTAPETLQDNLVNELAKLLNIETLSLNVSEIFKSNVGYSADALTAIGGALRTVGES